MTIERNLLIDEIEKMRDQHQFSERKQSVKKQYFEKTLEEYQSQLHESNEKIKEYETQLNQLTFSKIVPFEEDQDSRESDYRNS